MVSRKEFYRVESILKGVANHRRIEMLELVQKEGGASSEAISDMLDINYQTGSSHLRKLVRSGLISSHRQGQSISHNITPLGLKVLTFLKKLK